MNPRRRILLSSPFRMADNWRQSSAGLWLAPDDLTSQFQESTGVTAAAVNSPVGLGLDKKLGLVLGSELVTLGDFSASTGWSAAAGVTIGAGVATFAAVDSSSALYRSVSVSAGKTYQLEFDLVVSSGSVEPSIFGDTAGPGSSSSGHKVYRMTATAPNGNVGFRANAFTGSIDNISVREIPGIHLLQATAAARSTLKLDGAIYSWLDDGTDDASASAAFSAGTLTSNMDAYITVKKNAATGYCAMAQAAGHANFFGRATSGGAGASYANCGTPTVFVNGTAIGTTEGDLHTALWSGSAAWGVLEYHNLDLSAWTALFRGFYSGAYPGSANTGAIVICAAGTDARRAKNRRYLSRKVGI